MTGLSPDMARLCEQMIRARDLFMDNQSNAEVRRVLVQGGALAERLRWPSRQLSPAPETD